MKTKRILCTLICALMIAMLLPESALAAVGGTFTAGGIKYNVLTEIDTAGSVEVISNGYSGAVVIPATVDNGGVTYAVTKIGNTAFQGCTLLTSVTIPDTVNEIGNSAFVQTGLTSFHIPVGVTVINTAAFYRNPGLTQITVDAANTAFKSIDGVLFSLDGKRLIQYPTGKTGTYYCIPDGVETISDGAFSYSPWLTLADMPASLTEIKNNAFSFCSPILAAYFAGNAPTFGMGVFMGCPCTLYYPTGATGFTGISGVTVSEYTPYTLAVVNGTGGGSFRQSRTVAISAAVPAGYSFSNWVTADGGVFGDAMSTNTTFTMPGNNATVTAVLLDILAPTVQTVALGSDPAPVDGVLSITFSESMNTAADTVSLSPGSITLTSGTWSSGNTVYSIPYSSLSHSTSYNVSISGFQDAAGNSMTADAAHTFTTGAPPPPAYSYRTITDIPTGITVSGYLSPDAALTVNNINLHPAGTCSACDAIRSRMKDQNYLMTLSKDIALSHSFTGTLNLTVPMGTQYNGKTVTMLCCKAGLLETLTSMVANGSASFTVTSLSMFALFADAPTPAPTPTATVANAPTTAPAPMATVAAVPTATPVLSHNPKTGDDGPGFILWLLLGSAALGLAAIILFIKTKHYH